MKETKLKPCPFCGSVEEPFIIEYGPRNDRRWNLDHYCPHDEDDRITMVINIYGKSRDEVIERWNGRADDGQF